MMNLSPELSPRLRMLADMVAQGATLADIGTDHAYLPAALVLEGKIPFAIAADLRTGPLARAKETVRTLHLCKHFDFRLCDGLSGIARGEVDTVVIAGMGGQTIAAILQQAPWVRAQNITLLLQPMSTMQYLREFLLEHDYYIHEERLVQEGDTLYTALRVGAGAMPPFSKGELYVGKNTNLPLRGAWLTLWQGKVLYALTGVEKAEQTPETARRRTQLLQLEQELSYMKQEWEQWQR